MIRLTPLASFTVLARQNFSTFNSAARYLGWTTMILIIGLLLNTGRVLYAEVIFFGDSLSDSGNLYLLSGADVDPTGTPFDPNSVYSRFPTPPYNTGRATNGQVWTEQFASLLGYPGLQPSLAGGTNYAVISALTRDVPEHNIASPFGAPDMDTQVSHYLAFNTPSATDIFVFWGGANDFFFGQTDPTVPVAAISEQITRLANQGATTFVILNLPPLGYTPSGAAANPDGLNALCYFFNLLLEPAIDSLRNSLGVNIFEVDTNTFFMLVISDPATFGFTNATDPAVASDFELDSPRFGFPLFPAVVAADPNAYLFWDGVHPGQRGHYLFSELAYAQIIESLSDQTQLVIDFFQESVATGDLAGSGPAKSVNGRLDALQNMILAARVLVEEGMFEDAFGQLTQVHRRCDGGQQVPDFVEGNACSRLEEMVLELLENMLALAS
jgi:phospholipase/lecithinase/hemolysin